METISPMWFIILGITGFFVTHAYGENMPLKTLYSGTHQEVMLGLKAFKASITRRDSITSTPPSHSPSPSPSPLPSQDLKKPHVYLVTSYGADPTGNSDSTEALLAAMSDAAKGTSEGFLMKDIKDLGGAQINLEGGKYVISQPLKLPLAGVGNLMIHGGTIRASNNFPSDRHLIDLSTSGESKSYDYEYITFKDLLLDSNFKGGGISVKNSLRNLLDFVTLKEIIGKSKWHQLKAKFNAEEMETLEANLAPSHRTKKQKIDIEKEKSNVKQKIDVGQKIGVQTANVEHEGEANIEIIDITDPEVGQKDTEKKSVNNSNLESGSKPEDIAASNDASTRPKTLHQRYDSSYPLERLDHISMSSDVTSLWNAKLTAEAFYKEDPAYIADRAMIEKVGPVQGLDSVQVFLQRSISVVDHWKKKWEKNVSQMHKLKGENAEIAPLTAELSEVKKKLGETTKAFKISVRTNKSSSAKVEELLNKVKMMEEEKELQKKTILELEIKIKEGEGHAQQLQGELQELKVKVLGDMKRISDLEKKNMELSKELTATEYHAVMEHKRGFAKAIRQAKFIAPEIDFGEVHVDKDVFEGKIINEDEIFEDSSSNEEDNT